MQYMVLETFKPGKADDVYERFNLKGRMLPEGLLYIDSWLSSDRTRCFQLMETDSVGLFDEWVCHWKDLIEFEIIPLTDSP